MGAIAHVVVMRRLRGAAQLTRVIATHGLLGLIDGLFNLKLRNSQIIPGYFLPNTGSSSTAAGSAALTTCGCSASRWS